MRKSRAMRRQVKSRPIVKVPTIVRGVSVADWRVSLFPRSAWEHAARDAPRRPATANDWSTASASASDAERPYSAFPRGAWERERGVAAYRCGILPQGNPLMRSILRSLLPPIAALLLCCVWIGSVHAVENNSSYQAALESIKADELAEQVSHLADPAMEGREAGTRGGRAAGDYLAGSTPSSPARRRATRRFLPALRAQLPQYPGDLRRQRSEAARSGDRRRRPLRPPRLWRPRPSLGPFGYIHPGADDNASGTAAVLELAKAFTILPPRRSGRSSLRLGTRRRRGSWARSTGSPIRPFPLGPRRGGAELGHGRPAPRRPFDRLGSRSGYGWRRLLSSQNETPACDRFLLGLKPNADHYPFFEHGIPVLMFHTGIHDDYHRPSDVASRSTATE